MIIHYKCKAFVASSPTATLLLPYAALQALYCPRVSETSSNSTWKKAKSGRHKISPIWTTLRTTYLAVLGDERSLPLTPTQALSHSLLATYIHHVWLSLFIHWDKRAHTRNAYVQSTCIQEKLHDVERRKHSAGSGRVIEPRRRETCIRERRGLARDGPKLGKICTNLERQPSAWCGGPVAPECMGWLARL